MQRGIFISCAAKFIIFIRDFTYEYIAWLKIPMKYVIFMVLKRNQVNDTDTQKFLLILGAFI
jgi:hypothetical protein